MRYNSTRKQTDCDHTLLKEHGMRTIVEILSDGEFISGEAISRELGVSRAAVWKRICQLKEAGWQIESGGKRGYRLICGDALEPELWKSRLTTRELGRGEVLYSPEVGSTNTECKQLALRGAPNGSVCLCERQTAGKGRLGRRWESPAGAGLWQSVLLRPRLAPASAPLITLCAALAMAQAVEECCALPVRIKWPNDLVCEGRKLCGILLEMSGDMDAIESVVVGVGLNVRRAAYPPELIGKAGAIEDFTTPPLRREILLHYLSALEHAMDVLEARGFEGIREPYAARSCTLGGRVNVSGSVNLSGVAEALDDTGALLVRTGDGVLHRVLSGDVSVRGVMGYV